MIVGCCGVKGGGGKTTTALQVALIRASQGAKVLLIDADAQASASIAMSNREIPPLDVLHVTGGKALVQTIEGKRNVYDLIVVDVGGRDSDSLRAALIVADIALIPFAPRSLDVWALTDTAKLVVEARASGNPNLRAMAFLNGADAVGTDNQDAAAAVASIDGIEFLDCPVKRRKGIANAVGWGKAVTEMKPRDAKACAEFLALVKAITQPKLI